MPSRYIPTKQEGLYIQYRLKSLGKKLANISQGLSLNNSTFYNVIYGKRRSARIEAEIARILGKASWNDVVLEARSEVQKKPVAVILREMEQKARERSKADKERMARYIAENSERADAIIQAGFVRQKRRGA
jgi:Zn-dependent oligopeptidase